MNQEEDINKNLELNKVYLGNCIEVMKTFPQNSIACCITDPPYNYEFIGHKWSDSEVQRRTERVKDSKTMVSQKYSLWKWACRRSEKCTMV